MAELLDEGSSDTDMEVLSDGDDLKLGSGGGVTPDCGVRTSGGG